MIVRTGAAELTVNDSDTSLLPPLVVDTLSVPLYVPAARPVLGRTLTLDVPPADIVPVGDAVISKLVPPATMLALTPVNATDPCVAYCCCYRTLVSIACC